MNNIELYYESLNQVYKRILEKVSSNDPLLVKISNYFLGFSIIIFIISLVPILPSVLVFLGSKYNWVLFSYELNQSSIWTYAIAWISFTLLTIPLIPISISLQTKAENRTRKKEKESTQSLSSDQIAFIHAYEAYKV